MYRISLLLSASVFINTSTIVNSVPSMQIEIYIGTGRQTLTSLVRFKMLSNAWRSLSSAPRTRIKNESKMDHVSN